MERCAIFCILYLCFFFPHSTFRWFNGDRSFHPCEGGLRGGKIHGRAERSGFRSTLRASPAAPRRPRLEGLYKCKSIKLATKLRLLSKNPPLQEQPPRFWFRISGKIKGSVSKGRGVFLIHPSKLSTKSSSRIKFKFKTGYPGKIHLLSPLIKFHHHPRVTKERKILSKTVDPHLQRFS